MITPKIKVGGLEFTVEIVDEPLILDGEIKSGIINYDKLTIKIRDGLCEQRIEEILLHEITHAIDFVSGSRMTEQQTVAFTNLLLQVLRDNSTMFGMWRWKKNE